MQIGLLTTSFPRHPSDLAGSFVAEMATWLADHGDSIEVLAPAPARLDHPRILVRSLRYALWPRLFYGAGAPDNLSHLRAWPQIPAFLGRLALECRRRSTRWDAIISHWLAPCGVVAGLTTELPHLAVAHSSDVHLMMRSTFGPLMLRRIARPRTVLVLTSEHLRPLLSSIAHDRQTMRLVEEAMVQRMGIFPRPSPAAAEIEALRARFGLAGKCVVLFIGRLVAVKGVHRLLQAAAGLPNIQVVVIGDGPERGPLEALARELNCPALFLGEKVGPEKEQWLHLCQVLVLPSVVLPDGRTDSAPLVLLEAMAAGTAVVASRIGGNEALIQDGENGLLVDARGSSSLRAAIVQLSAQPELRKRLAMEGARTAEQYTWDRVGPALRTALERVMG